MIARTCALLLCAALLPAFGQDPVAAAVASFEDGARLLRPGGKAVQSALRSAARGLRNKDAAPAIEVLRMLGSQAGGATEVVALEEAKQADAIKQVVDSATTIVGAGLLARPALLPRIAATEGAEKALLEILSRQLAVAEALREIKSYTSKGSSGFFDGMFPKTAALGEEGADAFVLIYTSGDYPQDVRSLAGEGSAQLGSKKHVAQIRVLYEDTFEIEALREKAKVVLARLGDRSLHEKDLAAVETRIKPAREALPGLREKFQQLRPRYQELEAKSERTKEEGEELEKLKTELGQLSNDLIRGTLQVAQGCEQLAILHQNVRDQEKSEASYLQAVRTYSSIAPYIEQNQQLKQNVATAYYNLACSFALQKKVDRAFLAIDRSFRWGYSNFDWAETDGDLAVLRSDPRWKALVEEVRGGKAAERWKNEPEVFPLSDAEKEKARPKEGEEKPPASPGEKQGGS